MNSAAVHSAKLIAEFEKQQQQDEVDQIPEYPSKHPFGATTAGPFGGAAASTSPSTCTASLGNRNAEHTAGDAFAADNEMSNFADWDAAHPAAAAPSDSTDVTPYTAQAGPSHPRPLTQFDYPGGWGAQTHPSLGGLTQTSAARIATIQAKLNQRLGPEYLSQRPGPGGGKKLTYIEGWKLVDLANEVFGFNGWSTTIVRLDVDFLDCSPDGTRFNAGVSCVVRVTLRDGAFHEDIGYGSAENARQKHAALEKGKKEAVTDATKRALKNFGKLLGNCTYDHQYSANALKVSNPPPKFDASELHRRPELRQPPPPPPQVPQQTTAPASAARTAQAPAPVVSGNHASASTSAPIRSIPATLTAAPQQQPPSAISVAPKAVSADKPPAPAPQPATVEPIKDSALERQQRSALARQAYLERQQAEALKSTSSTSLANGSTDPSSVSHTVITGRRTNPTAVASDFGSDSFDDGLNDVLATYDETDLADSEAASHALEMSIDPPNAADDSGVAFESSLVQIKQEKAELRRSTSPVKQVKMEANVQPRRAGSVGRFIDAKDVQMRNGSTSLSAASGGGVRVPQRRTLAQSLGGGLGGVEGMGMIMDTAGAGRARGEPMGHGFVTATAAGEMRGLKRPNEADTTGRPNGIVRQS